MAASDAALFHEDGTLQILVPDVQFLGYIKKNNDVVIQITIEELTGIECEVEFCHHRTGR